MEKFIHETDPAILEFLAIAEENIPESRVGEICSECNTEIQEMYIEHPGLGQFCLCGRSQTD
ncbi:hypothetical protein bcgnr5372_38400 [Bacillus luti]|nr:hypothetical protein [Bacillus cereus]HDR8327223.1 hypothetical protein [Bacillus cereus]HDR8336413.1 hypothetical protein [Bacillus cereus]